MKNWSIKARLTKLLTENIGKLLACLLLVVLAWPVGVAALGSSQNPQTGSQGVEGEITGPPPKNAPTLAIPSGGQIFTNIPISLQGLCQNGLLVKVFSNNVFVGSVTCSNNSFNIKIDLFSGTNDITTQQFDGLDQGGPMSGKITVVYKDQPLLQFGSQVSLTSDYARRGTDPGQSLSWPIILSGGTGPYAISIDWGDGSPETLMSEQYPGTINPSHTYSSAGTYNVLIKATDKNNTSAYLQVVAVVNGNATQQAGATNSKNSSASTTPEVLWWPSAVAIGISIACFWLGRRYELSSLRKRLEKSYHS